MRRIEYGSGEFLGIEGCDVSIVRFGLAGDLGLSSPFRDPILETLLSLEEKQGFAEYWTDHQVAEIPLTPDYVATCGIAVASWILDNPSNPRLNQKTAEYAFSEQQRKIATTAESFLGWQATCLVPTLSYQEFLQKHVRSWQNHILLAHRY